MSFDILTEIQELVDKIETLVGIAYGNTDGDFSHIKSKKQEILLAKEIQARAIDLEKEMKEELIDLID